MKNIFLLIFLIASTSVFAQNNEKQEFKRDITSNEISLNVLDILAFGALNISYEHILSDHSSYSIEVFNKLFNKNEGEEVDLSQAYSKSFSLTGKFKYFFDEGKRAYGLYAQAFGTFSHGKNGHDIERVNDETGETENIEVPIEFSDIAIGIGGGYKLVSKQGFFADLGVGFGRNLFHRYSPDFLVLSNVSIGFRF